MRALFDCTNLMPGQKVLFLANGERQLADSTGKAIVPFHSPADSLLKPKEVHFTAPAKLSVTKCVICGADVPGKRRDRQFCSGRCRVKAYRGRQ